LRFAMAIPPVLMVIMFLLWKATSTGQRAD
jgi:hypothetical protein